MNPPQTLLGKKIRQLRRLRGFSQRRLAELAEVSNDYVSKIEKGDNENIGILTLKRMADALMVNSFELQSPEELSEKALRPEKAMKPQPKRGRGKGYDFRPDEATRILLKYWSNLDRADRKVILSVAKQLTR